nr:hypothetical protein [Tanacetum cinerariifolium]
MDDPNITMEEYIRLEEEKARRCGKVYNWETVTYENDNDKVNKPLFPSPELKDNDDDKVDIEHSSGDLSVKPLPDVINKDVGAYAQSNYGVTCEDEAKRHKFGTKTKTFEENYYLLLYAVSSKEDTAYQRQFTTRIHDCSYLGLRKKNRLSLKNDMPPRNK